MVDVADRPARQQRIAVLAVARDRARAVGHVVALGCQILGLRPCSGQPNQVRSKRPRLAAVGTARTSCRNTRSASSASTPSPRLWISSRLRGPRPRTLVDVVGGHAQPRAIARRQRPKREPVTVKRPGRVVGRSSRSTRRDRQTRANAGSPRRCWARSSGRPPRATAATDGAGARAASSATRRPAGTVRPNTCSVLCDHARARNGGARPGRSRRRWRKLPVAQCRMAAPPGGRSRCRSLRPPPRTQVSASGSSTLIPSSR